MPMPGGTTLDSGAALFFVSAIRAIVEMLGLALIARGVLHLIAGRARAENPIHALFCLLTAHPLRLTARLLPAGASSGLVGLLTFLWLFALWVGLAVLRKFV